MAKLNFQQPLQFFDLKEQYLFEIYIFCDIINVFTVTFDQFNASLLNKNINFLKKWNYIKIMTNIYGQ